MATRTWTGASSGAYGTAGNWAEAAVPVNGDDIVFSNNTVSVTSGLDQSAVTPGSVTIDSSYTGVIGVVASATFLKFAAVTNGVSIGVPNGQASGIGSKTILLNITTSATTITVVSSSTVGPDQYTPPIQLLGAHLVINAIAGNIGVALGSGQTATIDSLNINGSATITLGAGVTPTAITINGGTVYTRSAIAAPAVTLTSQSSRYINSGTGSHTTINVNAGTLIYNGVGTITTMNLRGTADFSQDTRAKTITTTNIYPGASLLCRNGVKGFLTFTNPINFQKCDVKDVNLQLWDSLTLAPA